MTPARRPGPAALPCGDIHRRRPGEEEDGGEAASPLPVLTVHDGRFASHDARSCVEAAQKRAVTPRMSDAQREAHDLEALDLPAGSGEALCYAMALEPGDMQFLNNHVVCHAHGEFRDDPATGQVRNLFRVRLSTPNSRALSPCFSVLFGATDPGTLRGGSRQAADGANAPHA